MQAHPPDPPQAGNPDADRDDSFVVERVEPGRVLIRPVSQVVLRLKAADTGDRFAATVDLVLRWLSRRAGRPLPEAAWKHQAFETSEIGSQRVSAVALSDPRYWAARLDDACKVVPLRSWITEIGIGLGPDGDVLFGTRLTCTMRGAIVPIDRTVPVFVREIVGSGPVSIDGRPVFQRPWVIKSEADVDELVNLLEDTGRTCDVIVLATTQGSESPESTAISADDLVRRTIGAAHVVVLTSSAVRPFLERVGRELSIGNRAIRLYRPAFSRVSDNPRRHLFYLADRIATWNEGGLEGFPSWIASRALQTSVQGLAREDRLPGFTTVRQAAAQMERQKAIERGGSEAEMLRLYQEDNEQLRKEIEEQKQTNRGSLEEAERERNQAQLELQDVRSEGFALRERIRVLEERAATQGAKEEVPIPETTELFEQWCQTYLAGRVQLHSRAFQGVKKSVFRDATVLYKALLLLRDHYVPMKRQGGKDLVAAFNQACQELDIENSLVGEAVKRYRSEYAIQWAGQPRTLDWHLKHGDQRERAKCFRLYYFWDDETECVVVGDMPAHLKSDLT